jgi:putative flippase GtrA
MLRWWIVGVVFLGVNIALLYLFIDMIGLPVLVSTFIAAEIGVLLRFVVNDRWVFRQSGITLQRLWQYHVAIAGSFAVWWISTNVIVFFGGHYMIASVIGMACSVLLSIATNFFWIWTHKSQGPPKSARQPLDRG